MKKKIFFTGLAIFCLGLLLGAFSSCYAFTEDDCKSLIYNMYVYGWERNSDQTKTELENINWSNWTSYFDNDNYQLFLTANFDTIKLAVRYKTGKPYNVSNNYGNTIWDTSFVGFWINYKNVNSITINPTNNTTSNFEWYGTARGYYTQFDVYTSSNSNDKVISAGDCSRDFLFYENEYNKQEIFGFEEVSTNDHVKIASDGVSMPLYYAPGSSVYFADFIDDDGTGQINFGKIITGDELYMYYYTTNSWNGSVNLFRRNFNSLNDFSSNRYININRPLSDHTINKISLKSPYILTNVVYNYIINYEEDGISKFINYYFYIGDNNTTTINGVIDVPSSIPDLDIYHNRINNTTDIVNNNDNTDNIINTIKSGDDNIQNLITDSSEVDNILNGLTSGDDINSLVNSLGLTILPNPFTDVIFNVFYGIINVLTLDQDTALNFGYGGRDVWVYASQFTTPANNPVVILIKTLLIFGYCYGMYWLAFSIFEKLRNFELLWELVNLDNFSLYSDGSGELKWRLL